MWLRGTLAALAALWAGAAAAGPGDPLRVTGDGVNVRSAPALDAGVLLQVDLEEPVIERGRRGPWVQVELPDRQASGWIHGSLLATPPSAERGQRSLPPVPAPGEGAQAAPAPPALPPVETVLAAVERTAPAAADAAAMGQTAVARAGPGPGAALAAAVDQAALARFRASMEYLNSRIEPRGPGLFVGVRPVAEGAVLVVAGERWAGIPEAGRQGHLGTLFDRWVAASSATATLRLELVDRGGTVMMSMIGP